MTCDPSDRYSDVDASCVALVIVSASAGVGSSGQSIAPSSVQLVVRYAPEMINSLVPFAVGVPAMILSTRLPPTTAIDARTLPRAEMRTALPIRQVAGYRTDCPLMVTLTSRADHATVNG